MADIVIPPQVAKELQREFDYQGVYVSLESAAKIAAAALRAWPGMEVHVFHPSWRGNFINLPLPAQEKREINVTEWDKTRWD